MLEPGWAEEAQRFIRDCPDKAAVFTLQFDAKGFAPRVIASGAMARTRVLKTPYGDQGLLISKTEYDAVGGFAALPLMEDVAFIRRLTKTKGGEVLHVLQAKAVTSAERYERDGYARRAVKNMMILTRYFLGASPEELAKDYR